MEEVNKVKVDNNSSDKGLDKSLERRKFIFRSVKMSGLAVLGGLIWGGYLNEAKSSPLIIRPPGAIPERDFLSACIRCGLCVDACKDKVGLNYPLRLAKLGDQKPIGTPYFIPRDKPCIMCTDIPCVPICPTEALDDSMVTSKSGELDINMSRMGLAMVDRDSCIAFWGIQCDVCYRVCPLIDKAITLDYARNKRTGKHAFLIPVVNSDYCTGCGICEERCVTEKAAIFILPRELAMGKVGSHYIKGWDKADELRLKNRPSDFTTETLRSKKKSTDYLNEGIDND